jgi:outer membrane lipoprotein SlyB
VVKPFIGTFLNNAIGWLAGGPLGGFFSLMSNVANTAGKIDDILHTVDNMLGGGILGLPQEAQENLQEGTAWAQAQTLLE